MSFFEDRGELGPPPEPFRLGGQESRSPVSLRWIGIAALVLVTYVALNVGKSIFVDFLWFDSVELASVFRTVIVAKLVLFLAGTLVSIAVIGANIWIARRLAPTGPEESFIEEIDPEAIRRIVTVLLVAGTLFLGVIFGSVASGAWETLLLAQHGVSFGIADAQFGQDVSFYLFTLPALHFAQGWAIGLVIISALAAASVYGLSMSLQRFEFNIVGGIRIHLSILVGLIFVLVAASTFLGVYDLVSSTGGIVHGATYTDVNARLPVRYVLVALALFVAAATIANAFLSPSGFRAPIFAFTLWSLVAFGGAVLYPSFVQSVQVGPNERVKELPYIARNIEATRYAYGLDTIKETQFPAEVSVDQAELDANPDTLRNIRLLDAIPLRDTFNQIQAIRPLYVFVDVDVDRYTIAGKTTQVMTAPRELDVTRVADRNWTQERLQLTHGYGAVIAPVNEVGAEGLPLLITSEIPPRSDVIPISESGARIYFGERTDGYVIARSREQEFDYPLGAGNAETQYSEDRGIQLNSLARRLALAWQLGDANLLISGQVTADSRLLMHRNIADRVRRVAPFLRLDSDPYVVVLEGRLMWIQAAYTATDRFPYSQPVDTTFGRVNYARNSVQVTVDAQTGDMKFYIMDEQDPVVRTWRSIFPQLFEQQDAMPASVRAHIRYPVDMFKLQAQLYLRYHITDPSVFFLGEDLWNIPNEKFHDKEQPVEPYYVVMRLPDEEPATAEGVEFVAIMPFTPRNRQNTVAWLAGRSDGEAFGTLRAYRFPTEDLVYGPAQIEARIDQNPGISAQMTLWSQSGSQVIRGNLLMIPIGASFLFVEPVYLQAENSRLPELVRVIVANGNQIAMEPTFQHSLDVVMGKRASSLTGITQGQTGGAAPTPQPGGPQPTPTATGTPRPAAPSGSIEDLLRQARESSNATQQELDRLRAILEAIQTQLQQQPAR